MKRILIAVLALFCSSAYAERVALSGQFEKVIIQMEDNKVAHLTCTSSGQKLYRLEGRSDVGGMIAWAAVCASGTSVSQKLPSTAEWVVFHHESTRDEVKLKSVSFIGADCTHREDAWHCNDWIGLKKATVRYEKKAMRLMDDKEALRIFSAGEEGTH